MAKFVMKKQLGDLGYLPSFFDYASTAIASKSSKKITVEDDNGAQMIYSGSGLKAKGDEFTGGTVNKVEFRDADGDTLMVISGGKFALKKLSVTDVVDNFMIFEQGNDKVIGSKKGDYILYGNNEGKDKILSYGGNDYIQGSDGKDTIDAGNGKHDVLTFEWTAYTFPSGLSGINANLANGKVVDAWGKTDKVTGIEDIRGTNFDDLFKGSAKNEFFLGYMGDDTFTGGRGDDVFEIYIGHGKDVITDFNKGDDTVLLGLMGEIDTYKEVKALMEEKKGDVVIDFGYESRLTLADTKISDLKSSDFEFLA